MGSEVQNELKTLEGSQKKKRVHAASGLAHFFEVLVVGPLWFCQKRGFSLRILLSSRFLVIQVRKVVIITYDFCSTYWWFSTCLKLKLCGCSHSSLFFFLRHLLGDIDIAKSEGKFSMFFLCFFDWRHPKREELHSPTLIHDRHAKKLLPCRNLLATTLFDWCKTEKWLKNDRNFHLKIERQIGREKPIDIWLFFGFVERPLRELKFTPPFLTFS